MQNKITEYCTSLGLELIGFIPYRRFTELVPYFLHRKNNSLEIEFEEADIEKRIDAKYQMEGVKTIISIAFPYNDNQSVNNGFSIYTQRLDYHIVVKSYLDKICEHISTLGGEAIGLVDSNPLPERYIAYLAGLGTIGKNNLLITKKYGSYVFLGEILTNLSINCEEKNDIKNILTYSQCGTCQVCEYKCPSNCTQNANTSKCLSYLTQKKHITLDEISLLQGNIFGCDLCQINCPQNQQINYSTVDDFKSLDYMANPYHNYATIDNKFFRDYLKKTSCGWRGKNIIQRNAIIAMDRANQNITQLDINSQYVKDYVTMLKL
ncbi:MAG: epoxyqueuosine reductase [Epulopiscium sp. Nele67-Bin004]|nr:MAG: epoxyqueuosine reductase [Epulopiscium sp. Nele67-Bin004]